MGGMRDARQVVMKCLPGTFYDRVTARLSCCVLAMALVAVGCGDDGLRDDAEDSSKVSVVASVFPLAEAARAVGGSLVNVIDLTPAGVEPHDLELTTHQVDMVYDARLVLVMGNAFQPGLEEVARKRKGPTSVLLESPTVSKNGVEGAAGEALADDPHVWLDPLRMGAIVGEIVEALGNVDPDNEAAYASNGKRWVAELQALDARFVRALTTCERRTIVVAHEAFGWLALRYGLTQLSLAGISPEAEPDPRRTADLAERMKAEEITTVFTEPLAPVGVAELLAGEAGAKVATLDPLEVLNEEQEKKGATYRSVMEANLIALGTALDCRAS